MMYWQALGVGFMVTLGVEIALGVCIAIGEIIKGAGKK